MNPKLKIRVFGQILGIRQGWGSRRLKQLNLLLNRLIIIDINDADQKLLEAYARIDTFSQGKLKEKPLNLTARNMGKNDLWIAATTFVTKATLITTDADFDHLNKQFFSVKRYLIQ